VIDGTSVWLFSYDPPCFRDTGVCRWPLEPGAVPNALELTAAGTAVIVSPTFARDRGLQPGMIVSLASPSGPQSFMVAGIAAEEPSNAVILSRQRYAGSWNDPMVTWVHVAVTDPAAVRDVGAEIARRLGRTRRVLVRPVAEFVGYLAGQVRQAFRLLYVMEAVTLALILFGLTDALAAGVLERTRYLGLMRAVGVRRGRIFGMVMLEGIALGILGLVLAAAVGLGLSAFWVRVEFPMLLGWGLDYEIPGPFIAVAIALTMVLSLAGAVGPSLRAARLEITDALKEE
jgi:putative ABC transport system permease protein